MRHQLLSVLFIVLTITSLTLAFRRDYDSTNHGLINPFEYEFTDSDNSVDAAGSDGSISRPTTITLYDPNHASKAVGQFRFECRCDGKGQFDFSIPIDLNLEVQQKLTIRDVYVWVGREGSQPLSSYPDWDNSGIASGGVTFVYRALNNGFLFHRQITLGDIISVLRNADGSYRTCFRIEIVVHVQRHCGFTHTPKALEHSPAGCDFDYQAIYPATDSYFHVGLTNEQNLEGLYFKGYCLDPTRSIYPNHVYTGAIYSSYDPQVLGSNAGEFVEAPQNLPIVNYIANHEQEYLSRFLSGHQCTWQDVQNAIWTILFPVATSANPELLNILPVNTTTKECVSWIVNDASAHRNYTPSCPGGKYLLILFPSIEVNGTADANCTKDLETQLIAFPTGGSCLNKCQPKICDDILRKGRRLCLTGECRPPSPSPSYSPSITSKPILPSPDASTSSTSSASTTSVPSQSQTPTASPTSVASESQTPTSSPTSVASQSQTPTASPTSVASESQTPTASPTSVASESQTPTASPTSYASQSQTPTSSPTSVASQSQTPTASPTSVASQSETPTSSPTSVASQSQTATVSPTSVASYTASITSKPILPSPDASTSNTASISLSRTSRPSQSVTSTPCPSRSSAPSVSRSSCPSRSVTSTPCPSRSSRPSESPCHSRSTRPSRSVTSTPCPSRSSRPSESSCPSKSTTRSHSSVPSQSRTSVPSQSRTSVPSVSSKPILPSQTHSPCHNMASASPSNSPPCHNMHSASPSNSPPCHGKKP